MRRKLIFLIGFLFEALSVFSFVCWAAPDNIPVNQLFGVHSGLGFSVLTFDWTQISWIGSPLMGMIILLTVGTHTLTGIYSSLVGRGSHLPWLRFILLDIDPSSVLLKRMFYNPSSIIYLTVSP